MYNERDAFDWLEIGTPGQGAYRESDRSKVYRVTAVVTGK